MKSLMRRTIALVLTLVVIFSFTSISAFAAKSKKYYYNQLVKAGFPEDYASLLAEVKVNHPTWTFTPLFTNLDFDDAVAGESKDGVTTTDVKVSYDLLISRNRGTYNSNGTYTYTIVDGNQAKQTGHADASDLCISFFMDPRNFFLEDRTIFQFLDMSYPEDDEGMLDALGEITKDTFLEGYESTIMSAGDTYDINPVYLVSKIFQEVGTDGKNSAVSGTVKGYEGYYNYYNIGAYASSDGTAVINGLKRAKEEGWNTRKKAIKGGAAFIANGYISVGQHTPYLTKFNVNPNNKSYSIYTHQYMSAVNDPAQSARTIYNAYIDIMDKIEINFVIPVYNNMPDFTDTTIKLKDSTDSAIAQEPTTEYFYTRETPSLIGNLGEKYENGTKVKILERVRSVDLVTDKNALYKFTLQYPFWYKIEVDKKISYTSFENIPVTKTVTMKIGDSRTFKYTLSTPVSNAVRFEVLDSRIATVDIKTGKVLAKKKGTTKLIAYTASGSVDYINLEVVEDESAPTELTSKTYTIDQKTQIVSGIKVGTTVKKLVSNINESEYCKVYDKDGVAQSNNTRLSTGMVLGLVINGSVVETYEIAVTGDTNGDGFVKTGDAVQVLQHISELQKLKGARAIAADTNKDGFIKTGDAVVILKSIS